MINRINPDKPYISRNKLKKWFQVAKQKKMVTTLYKMDNALKNTGGFGEYGFLQFIRNSNRNNKGISILLDSLDERFRYQSLKKTLTTDFWGYPTNS